MRLTEQIYSLLVNRVPGIRERYQKYREQNWSRFAAWLYLLWLNFAYYVLHIRSIGELRFGQRDKIRLLLTEAAESERIQRMSPEETARYLGTFDAISFDVFDTLIFRPFREPKDLFIIMGGLLEYPGLFRERLMAEQRAREESLIKNGHGEIGLYEIWKQMEKTSNLPALECARMEFDLEKKYTAANPYMYDIVCRLKKSGKKLAVCSDMYFSERQIRILLDNCGFPEFDQYIISSEYGCSKADGRLFEILKSCLHNSGNLIHVGDNEYSDVRRAKEHFVETWFYQAPGSAGKNFRPKDMSLMVGSFYAGIVNNTIYNGIGKYSPAYELGFIYGGLMATGYCQFIHEYSHNNQIDTLLFLSRDGHILWKLYRRMYPEDSIRSQYVYWSRLVAAKLAARKFKEKFFAGMVDYKINQGYSIKEIFYTMGQIGLLPEFLSYGNLTEKSLLDEKIAKLIRDFLNSRWDIVLQNYAAERKAAGEYYASVLKGSKRAAVVDVGWMGSGAKALRYLAQDEWKIPCEIISILGGTMSSGSGMPEANEASILLEQEAAYLFSPFHNRDLWTVHDGTSGHNMIVELLLSSDQPSFRGFTGRKENPFIFDSKRETIDSVEIQKGILDFSELFIKTAGDIKISGRDAMAPILVLYNNPKWIQQWIASSNIRMNIE